MASESSTGVKRRFYWLPFFNNSTGLNRKGQYSDPQLMSDAGPESENYNLSSRYAISKMCSTRRARHTCYNSTFKVAGDKLRPISRVCGVLGLDAGST